MSATVQVRPLVKPHPCDERTEGSIRHRHLHYAERVVGVVGGLSSIGLLLLYVLSHGHL